jgi:undecaprenyl-phosphate galactose phosphotransferase
MFEMEAVKFAPNQFDDLERHRKPLHVNVPKRIFDIVFSLLILTILSPAMLLIAVIVKSDGGPVVFRHKRIGADGKSFYCLKFRTMHINSAALLEDLLKHDPAAREEWQRDFKLRKDPRVTAVGAFLRKRSLDEFPQLWNVVRGEMSLVGPRPIVEAEVPRYREFFEHYKQCRPGLTGLWQVSGRSDIDYERRVMMDRNYAKNWSFANDVVILFKTPLIVLRSLGAY